MDGKGNDALLTTTKVTEFNFNYGGYISILFGVLFLFGCLSAYVIAVARGNVDPILPLISDAAGSPPQNGIFGTLLCVSGMFGVIFMIQRYMIVVEKNCEKSKLVTAINKLSLLVGIGSMFGITLITGYPINFYRNRDVWLKDVGLPHIIGEVMFSALGLVYICFQCVLTLFVKSRKTECSPLPIRILLLIVSTASYVYHLITVPEHIGGISHLYYLNTTEIEYNDTSLLPYPPTLGADLKLPIDTGGTYFTAAITEWAFVIFFCCFFFTFFHEMQQYSLQFIIETHTTQQPADSTEEAKLDFKKASLMQNNGSQVDSKPVPEMKKFLKRDSTCQTVEDTAKIIPVKNGKEKKLHGTKNLALDPELDAKLSKILGEVDKKESKKAENGTQSKLEQISPETDTEAERIAVEKFDAVVKTAERDVGTDAMEVEDSGRISDEDEEKPSACPLAVQ